MDEPTIESILLYETPDIGVQFEVRLDQDTVWLNQQQMTELFGRERSVITKHIRNIFQEGELELLEQLQRLGYAHLSQVIVAPDGSQPEREDYSDVILSQQHKLIFSPNWGCRVTMEYNLINRVTFMSS